MFRPCWKSRANSVFLSSFTNKGPVSRVFFFSYGMFSIRIRVCFCKISQISHARLLSSKIFLFFSPYMEQEGPQQGLPCFIFHRRPEWNTGYRRDLNTLSFSYRLEGWNAKHWTFCDGSFIVSWLHFFFLPLFLWEPLLSVSDWESVASLGTLRSAVRNKYCDRYHLSRTLDQVAVTFYQDETLMSFSVSQINHSILISETTECRRLQSSVSTSGIPCRNVGGKKSCNKTYKTFFGYLIK